MIKWLKCEWFFLEILAVDWLLWLTHAWCSIEKLRMNEKKKIVYVWPSNEPFQTKNSLIIRTKSCSSFPTRKHQHRQQKFLFSSPLNIHIHAKWKSDVEKKSWSKYSKIWHKLFWEHPKSFAQGKPSFRGRTCRVSKNEWREQPDGFASSAHILNEIIKYREEKRKRKHWNPCMHSTRLRRRLYNVWSIWKLYDVIVGQNGV